MHHSMVQVYSCLHLGLNFLCDNNPTLVKSNKVIKWHCMVRSLGPFDSTHSMHVLREDFVIQEEVEVSLSLGATMLSNMYCAKG